LGTIGNNAGKATHSQESLRGICRGRSVAKRKARLEL
jgi:hypothetical protein